MHVTRHSNEPIKDGSANRQRNIFVRGGLLKDLAVAGHVPHLLVKFKTEATCVNLKGLANLMRVWHINLSECSSRAGQTLLVALLLHLK